MMTDKLHLDARLEAALSFARQDAAAADVGTDHGYIPVALVGRGLAPRVVASDVNEGPLEAARRSAERFGVGTKIVTCLADGLCGLPLAENGVRDVYICGMGGELIASIIDASPYVRQADVRLILQPMTMQPELRRYLAGAGFAVLDEKLCRDRGHVYCVILAAYTGEVRTLSAVEALLGPCNLARGAAEPLFASYLKRAAEQTEKKRAGRARGGLPTAEEDELIAAIRAAAEKEGLAL